MYIQKKSCHYKFGIFIDNNMYNNFKNISIQRHCNFPHYFSQDFAKNKQKYKYYLQYERPYCIGYKNSSRRREGVCPIQHGR